MRDNKLRLRVGWPPRQESIEECADRLFRMLSELPACDAKLANWYEEAGSRKRTLARPVTVESRDCLLKLLNRGRHRLDSDKSVVEDLGFTFALWREDYRKRWTTIIVECGSYWEGGGNGVRLDLPDDLGDLARWEATARLLSAVAKVWDAENGDVGIIVGDPIVPNIPVTCRKYNWMLYYSRAARSEFPLLPDYARVVPVDPIGTIIVTQDEPPDVEDPEHVRNIERVETALKATV